MELLKQMKLLLRNLLKGRKKLLGQPENEVVAPLQVPIIMVSDRAGNMVHNVIENNTRENIEAVFPPVISADSVLCTDGNISYIGIAKNLNVTIKG